MVYCSSVEERIRWVQDLRNSTEREVLRAGQVEGEALVELRQPVGLPALGPAGVFVEQASAPQDVQLQALATRIVEQAQVLSRSHSRFTRNFKRDLADASVGPEDLLAAIDAYDRQYQSDLVALLTLQDQLHQALQPEEWRQVAAALNQTAVRLDNRIMGSN